MKLLLVFTIKNRELVHFQELLTFFFFLPRILDIVTWKIANKEGFFFWGGGVLGDYLTFCSIMSAMQKEGMGWKVILNSFGLLMRLEK